jgi:hypothetical protein
VTLWGIEEEEDGVKQGETDGEGLEVWSLERQTKSITTAARSLGR